METEEKNRKREIISHLLQQHLLLGPEALKDPLSLEKFPFTAESSKNSFVVVNPETLLLLEKENNANWIELERIKVLEEKGKRNKITPDYCELLPEKSEDENKQITKLKPDSVEVLFTYDKESKKRSIGDFVKYFNKRYSSLEKILRGRQELQSVVSISRVIAKKEKESIAIIGMVVEVRMTKNGNLMLTVEDPTGQIRAIVNKNKPELFEAVKNLVLDEVIGIVGVSSENIIFANNILWPDVPSTKELKKSPEESYAVFLSDIHVGSNEFLENEFNKFLKWINGGVGNEQQKEIAKKIKYVFVLGDLVDGVGVYPNQDKDLNITDIFDQYKKCAELLKKIPQNIQLIICPGNHDALRIAEPQPLFFKDFAEPLWELPNAIFVSNPSSVNIGKTEDFSGFDVLLYHGYSFDYYISNVDFLRNNGGYDRADLVMKFLMQRRHLAPSHTSTLYVPDPDEDPLVIKKVPDIFATGHIHKSIVANYKNITLICGSCWQAKTAFQEKVGHNPEPARVPVVNLQTREVKIIRFA